MKISQASVPSDGRARLVAQWDDAFYLDVINHPVQWLGTVTMVTDSDRILHVHNEGQWTRALYYENNSFICLCDARPAR